MAKTITLLCVFACLLYPKALLSAEEQSVSDIAERASPSVVQIIIYDITGTMRGEGSGFFIAAGQILTNAHVIEDAYSAEILSDIEYYDRVTVLKSDQDVDLALLSVEDRGESTLSFEEKQEIRPGQRIITIGNPMGLEKTVSDGIVSALRGIPGRIQVIQISAPVSPGSSGGPLLNEKGHVIGVASATLSEGQNLNFAIGIETIMDFLKEQNNPQQLHKAKSRVLWRVIIKWIGTIVLGLIALAFGGGWWIIFIIIMILWFMVWVFKSLYRLVTAPFRKRRRDIIDNYGSNEKSYSYEEASDDKSLDEAGIFADIEKDDKEGEDIFTFHCWKCGSEVHVDVLDRPHSIECDECGTKLSVPKE